MNKINRIFKSGINALIRNALLSVATITVITVTVFFISFFYLSNIITREIIDILEDQIDVSIFFKSGVSETDILTLRQELLSQAEVKNAEYISAEENLSRFRDRHLENPVISQSLDELEGNPLGGILNITAHNPEFYSSIVDYINNSPQQSLIFKLNYFESRPLIDKAEGLFSMVKKSALILGAVFVLLSILISYNAVRLAIYSSKKEIEIMRLVGANNWFIRGPFLVQGLIYGILGAILAFLLFIILTASASLRLEGFLPDPGILTYLKNNLWTLISVQFFSGIALAVISSYISIRKYLRV